MKAYRYFFKRMLDFVFSLMLILLFSPVFILTAFLLMIVNKGTPFFVQVRPGKNERLFRILKFKTMNDKKDTEGTPLPDSERLTAVGKLVRSLSLDELPQLFNVLLGDMSLVGPRPLLVVYLSKYNSEQKRRHQVRPGITGWAQINGRNAITWEEKFKLDVWYVDHISFQLDCRIFWKTFLKVCKKEGINQAGSATMEMFRGTENSR